ncbi:MAG: tryptophan synthase subunit alpha [Bacillaceae bacterium]|nr:tryptophan synthase subunit alpha [Bacillaceae bacterium]
MTSIIERTFSIVDKKPLFIPFIAAGDPSLKATVSIAKALQESGADMIELGVPYSDPLADGPTIQKASLRALKNGITLDDILETSVHMRMAGVTIPIILFTYYNPVLQYGIRRLFERFESSGIDGIIIPDLPIEENEEVKTWADHTGKPLISLIAPNSSERIERIASQADGFIYCVSSLGVTGERKKLHPQIHSFLQEVKQHARVPVAVGFGISSPEQVAELAPHSDGIIVGSAIVRIIEKNEETLLDPETRHLALAEIKTFVKHLYSGVL